MKKHRFDNNTLKMKGYFWQKFLLKHPPLFVLEAALLIVADMAWVFDSV